jgi:hypothetical protein
MARIDCDGKRIDIRLSPLDEVLSLHGSLHIPLTHVRSARHEPVPEEWFRGLRIGTNLPGVKVAGTFLTDDGMIFYDFHNPARCLVLELSHEHYRRVIVEVDKDQDPGQVAGIINGFLRPR